MRLSQKNFTKYDCQNDRKNTSNLFSKDGYYHDYIYLNFKGRNVVIPGMGCFKFKDSLIKNYSEAINGGFAMVQLGVNQLRIKKVFVKFLKRSLNEDSNSLEIKLTKLTYQNGFQKPLVKLLTYEWW